MLELLDVYFAPALASVRRCEEAAAVLCLRKMLNCWSTDIYENDWIRSFVGFSGTDVLSGPGAAGTAFAAVYSKASAAACAADSAVAALAAVCPQAEAAE